MKYYTKAELKNLSKNQLIQIILEFQDMYMRLEKIEEKLNIPQKTSKNSSISSSNDIRKENTENTERKKSGPKIGHKASVKKISNKPDMIIKINLEKCPRTGKELESKSKSYQKHQIFELIPGNIKVIEIQRQITTGPDGKTIIAPNPEGIEDNQYFGPYLQSIISLYRYKYHMEWDSIIDIFKTMYNIKVSKGALNHIFNKLREKLEPEYKMIENDIKNSKKIGIDETGARINGRKAWGWIFQNENNAYYKIDYSRGHKVVESVLGDKYNGTVITDFWGAYTEKNTKAGSYQKCIAHLNRDLEFAYEINNDPEYFPYKMKEIINKSIELKKNVKFNTEEYIAKKFIVLNEFEKLLGNDKIYKNSTEKRLRKRLIRFKGHIFTFLNIKDVPFDNNGSERDIRKLVIFRKIYGCFRSEFGANNLAIIFSILQTANKAGDNFFEKVLTAFNYTDFNKNLRLNFIR